MSNFKRIFLETIFSKRIKNISETAEPIYLKFGGFTKNLHKKGNL